MQSPPSSEWDEEFFDSSKPLQGVVVCCTSIPANERTNLGNKVVELGGQHEYDLTPKTTHLIVGEYDTTKYRHVAKSRPDIRPMAVGWIDAIRNLWVEDNPIDFRALEKKWMLKTFETGGGSLGQAGEVGETTKLLCCISGMDKEERDEWIEKIQANGGRYTGSLDKTATHLIIREPTGKKYLASMRWQQHIVVPEWVEDSIKRGMILDENCYSPHLPREEIGKGAWVKREIRRKSLGKRLREAAEAQVESGRRKLRKTASMKLNSQRDNMWGDILGQQASANQSGVSFQAEDPTQPLPSDSMLQKHVSVKDSLGEMNEGPAGIFSSCLFHISGFPRKHVEVLDTYITSRGGTLSSSLEGLNAQVSAWRRFIVVPQESSPTSHPPAADGVEIVTDFFIEKCIYRKGTAIPDSKAHVIGRPFPVFPIDDFDKLSICTSGFTELDLLHISKAVRQLGARYEERFTAQCSILVCTALGAVRKQKLDMAIAFGTPVVRADWLWECISRGKKLACEEFVFPELKSRLQKGLPNKALNRSKSVSDMNKRLTPKTLTGRTESTTRASLPGPDMSAFEDTPLADTDPPRPMSRSKLSSNDTSTKDSNLTSEFDTAPTHQAIPNSGSQQLPSRPVSRSASKALTEWSVNDINKANPKDQPASQPSRKPLARVRSEICDSEAGDDDGGLFDLTGDEDVALVQQRVTVEDPVEIEKRRLQYEKAEKDAAERKALSNKLTTLLEGTAGNNGSKSFDSNLSGAATDDNARSTSGIPPGRRKRGLIGRVISNASVASSGSQESSTGGLSGGGMARTHSAVMHHEDDSPGDEEPAAAAGPVATQIEYADPEAVKSKERLRSKMLGRSSVGAAATGAKSSSDQRLTMGALHDSAGGRSMRRR
ncbi:protein kinase activating protein dpb11 [Gnomoniopsis smithogilvyi]|uniref:Protein kinase activating protein dpb11 n=1 Tax=Gnomoniopsis smithogilvyi TaxID=1191159 RepID=A0A9W8YTP9_9PEZI|nr:protein kinase activating protein dpb11 [Gnomoniopsis smithogilvyi]